MNLYYLDVSPPCRSVLLLGRILGLEFNLKTVNIQNGDQLKKEFLELNPTHTVPTLQVWQCLKNYKLTIINNTKISFLLDRLLKII